MTTVHAAQPAPPFAEAKARLAAAVQASRAEIVELSHRIHADPEPAFEEHHAATWVAEALAAHGYRRRAPGRQPGHRGPRHASRRARRGRPADRHPGRVRRAARPRPRLRAQHDGRVRRRGRDRPGVAGRRAAGRDRVPRHARRGTGQRQADHDRRRAVRRARCRAALPPVRPLARRELPARVGGRRRRVQRAAVARLVRSVAGQERARRDDPAVHLGRAVAPAAPTDRAGPRDHPRGRHGGEHHPRPDRRLVHDPERRRGRLPTDARALRRAVPGGRAGDRHDASR